jgi:hypothetical protein
MEVDAEVLVPETPEPVAKFRKDGKKERGTSRSWKTQGEEGESPKKPKSRDDIVPCLIWWIAPLFLRAMPSRFHATIFAYYSALMLIYN